MPLNNVSASEPLRSFRDSNDSPLNERKGSDAEMLFNGKMSPFGGGRVGAPTVNSYDVPRFCARAHVFESCKVCVAACFGAYCCAHIYFVVQVSDRTCRTIGFVLLMYTLYG